MRHVYLICIHISSWTNFWNFVLAAALLEPNLCPGTAFSCAISLLNLVSRSKEALNSPSNTSDLWGAKKKKLGFLCRHGTRHWCFFCFILFEQLKKDRIHLFTWILYSCDWKFSTTVTVSPFLTSSVTFILFFISCTVRIPAHIIFGWSCCYFCVQKSFRWLSLFECQYNFLTFLTNFTTDSQVSVIPSM